MNIIKFSENLQERLKKIVSTVNPQNDLVSKAKTLNAIREIIDELKTFTVKYSFTDTQEEIRFFKEVKPVLVSQYYYHKQMFSIMLFDSFRDRKSRMENYYLVLEKLQRFVRRNEAFYEYCMSGATYLDTCYFTRNQYNAPAIDCDEKFSTGSDTKLAKILSHEMVKEFVISALHKLQDDKAQGTLLSWTDSKVALVELVYALHATGVFNHGKADLKQIVRCMEEAFSIDLGNYARVFSEIRIRKSGQTNFLDGLRERLLNIVDY